jgi:hypothetical protein
MDTFHGIKKAKEDRMSRSNPLKSYGFYMLNLLQSAVFRVIFRFNFRETINGLKKLGKKHSPYFFAYAGCIELLEDAVFPSGLHSVGKLQFIPTVLAFHCEPIAHPSICFAIASTFKRLGKLVHENCFLHGIFHPSWRLL